MAVCVPRAIRPLALLAIGLALLGIGASGIQGEAVSVTLIPVGFASAVAGVILPRTEGDFSFGGSGVKGHLAPIENISWGISTPAVVLKEVAVVDGTTAVEAAQPAGSITVGDIWDALDAAGVRDRGAAALNNQATYQGVGLGSAYFRLADGRMLKIPNRDFVDYGAVAPGLLALLVEWGIHPTASGKYPEPAGP